MIDRLSGHNPVPDSRRRDLAGWIHSHPAAAFFALALVFSWLVWFSAPVFSGGDPYVLQQWIALGTFGPALSAIVLSVWLNPGHEKTSSGRRTVIFLFLWPIFAFIFCAGKGPVFSQTFRWNGLPLDLFIAGFGAWIWSSSFSSQRGVRTLFLPLRSWRVKPVWYAVVLAGWPALLVVGNLLGRLFGYNQPLFTQSLSWNLIPHFLLLFFYVMLFAGGNEEPGWRGFALPHLQCRYSPLLASVMIGLVWGLWHLPLHMNGCYSAGLSNFWTRGMLLAYAIWFTWLYNRTGGNLLLAVLYHAVSNTASGLINWPYVPVFILGTILLMVLVIWDRMWRTPPVVPPNREYSHSGEGIECSLGSPLTSFPFSGGRSYRLRSNRVRNHP